MPSLAFCGNCGSDRIQVGGPSGMQRAVQPAGRIVVRPEVGGLHRYERQAA